MSPIQGRDVEIVQPFGQREHDASTAPSGRSAYVATSSAMRTRSAVVIGMSPSSPSASARRNAASATEPRWRSSR